jgi:hypothetical protein
MKGKRVAKRVDSQQARKKLGLRRSRKERRLVAKGPVRPDRCADDAHSRRAFARSEAACSKPAGHLSGRL